MKIIKLKLLILLCSLSFSATVLADNNPIFIKNVLTYLNKVWANQGESQKDITEKYFDPNIELVINGKKVFTGYDEFSSHFKEVSKHIVGKIQFPLLEVITTKDKIVVHFNEDIYAVNGKYYPANVLAIFTLNKERIIKWDEVVFTQYFFQEDSNKIVFNTHPSKI